MYRDGSPSLASVLEKHLGALGYAVVEPSRELAAAHGVVRMLRRKTWNTNRGIVLGALGCRFPRDYVEALRRDAGQELGSSWWSQLGLQIVFEVEGTGPSAQELAGLVDQVNTQGILVQSVFAVNSAAGEFAEGRTWGQVFTGRAQDAIASAIREYLASRRPA